MILSSAWRSYGVSFETAAVNVVGEKRAIQAQVVVLLEPIR